MHGKKTITTMKIVHIYQPASLQCNIAQYFSNLKNKAILQYMCKVMAVQRWMLFRHWSRFYVCPTFSITPVYSPLSSNTATIAVHTFSPILLLLIHISVCQSCRSEQFLGQEDHLGLDHRVGSI